MTRTEQTSAILRRAAADFLAVAPARAPRSKNPDPAVVSALFQFSFWRDIAEGGTPEHAESYAAWSAARIGNTYFSTYTKDWQYLRDIAAGYAA